MSLDLTLIPIEHDTDSFAFGHSLLGIDIGRRWHDLLNGCNTEPVPKNFTTFTARNGGNPHYGNTQETPYGEKLRCVRVSEILSRVKADLGWSNRDKAALSYLAHLDPDSRIALYWH